MKRQYYAVVVLLTLVMSACGGGGSSSDDDITPTPTPTPTPSDEKIEIKVSTRASDGNFESGDAIGLYVVNYVNGSSASLASSGNYANNVKFTYNGSSWTGGTTLYWSSDDVKADFYAYYPYATVTDATAYTFSLKTDQSLAADHKASDFLWGKLAGQSPTESTVNISVNHMFSKAIINVQAGDGFTEEELNSSDMSVGIYGVMTQARINLGDGSISATGTATSVTAFKTANCKFQALVVPQTVEETDLVIVTMNGNSYPLTQSMTFESNKEYIFTITLSKTSSGISVSVEPWGTAEGDYGGVVVNK